MDSVTTLSLIRHAEVEASYQGVFGGRIDMVVTFLINVRLAMPVVLVALAVVAIFGGSLEVVIIQQSLRPR